MVPLFLGTERLLLRTPQHRDASALALHFADYDVSKMTARIPYPYRRADADRFVAGADRETGHYVFAIARRPEDFCIGTIGLHREAEASDLGYALGKDYWGRGYATEAARAVVAFAFEALALDRLTASWFCDNPASGRVLAKLGFVLAGERECPCAARGHGVAAFCGALDRTAYDRRKTAP